ncbi:MAG: RluA family pseudouridine synthase [Pirellulales bacterium]
MPAPVVLRESAGVIAILKPAGLATQAPPGIPSVESWLRDRLHGGDRSGYIGVPHRLDRAVSGVLLMAATPRAARKLSRQFERRQVAKTYLAIVLAPRPDEAAAMAVGSVTEWRDLIEKRPDQAISRVADPASPTAREAVTVARRLPAPRRAWLPPALSDAMLLQLEPQTGRMHQLRLQTALRGMPILGDELYGGLPLTAGTDDDLRERPIMLHAWRIAYADPDSDELVTIDAALPAHWPRHDSAPSEPAAGEPACQEGGSEPA